MNGSVNMGKRTREWLVRLCVMALFAACCVLTAFGENARPYYIMVNRQQNTVTVYQQDAAGSYTIPCRAMVCSTARTGYETPLGTYALSGVKQRWSLMFDGTYAQYCSQYDGFYLFHSICYSAMEPSALLTEEYNALGSPASMGCVRLQTADAKWIYDNCPAGTGVCIYDSEDPGPLGKPDTLLPQITPALDKGWDPTDPDPANPWQSLRIANFYIRENRIEMTAGEAALLSAVTWPKGAVLPGVTWSSSDPRVAAVDDRGVITALGAGTAVITGTCGEKTDRCTVMVTGTLLEASDVPPGSWYYADVRFVLENSLLSLSQPQSFTPAQNLTGGMLAESLYGLEGWQPGPVQVLSRVEGDWRSAAGAWALENTLLSDELLRSQTVTRQELARALYRFETQYRGRKAPEPVSLAGFADYARIQAAYKPALRWAVRTGLLQGDSGGRLNADQTLTRAQAAAILHRYCENCENAA